MTRIELQKRLVKIEGKPLKAYVPPRAETRRETNKIKNTAEFEEIKFDDFFEFDEELMEMEAARRQVERIEEDKIIYENRLKALGIEKDQEISQDEKFITLDEKTIDEDVNKKEENVLINFRSCRFKKDNGEQCKRQAPKGNDYCRAHQKITARPE